jgi:hypothetical protein
MRSRSLLISHDSTEYRDAIAFIVFNSVLFILYHRLDCSTQPIHHQSEDTKSLIVELWLAGVGARWLWSAQTLDHFGLGETTRPLPFTAPCFLLNTCAPSAPTSPLQLFVQRFKQRRQLMINIFKSSLPQVSSYFHIDMQNQGLTLPNDQGTRLSSSCFHQGSHLSHRPMQVHS